MSKKICERGCGKYIIFLGKIHDKVGSTGWFEVENDKITQTEHTYKRCDKILKEIEESIENRKQYSTLFPNGQQ